MKLEDYLAQHVRVIFTDDKVYTGRIIDYTTSEDNDDEGEYLTIRPESGEFKDLDFMFYEDEIKSIEITD